MEALEFVRSLNRMCDSYETCGECGLITGRGIILCGKEDLEKAIPVVEKWSKEHPIKTNLDHYAEELEKLGFKVDKQTLHENCPVPKNTNFSKDLCSEHALVCAVCRMWWNEEYKGEE